MAAFDDTSAAYTSDPVVTNASVFASGRNMTPGTLQQRTPHARSRVSAEPEPDPSDTITLDSATIAPLEVEKTERVSARKFMTTKAALYRDGTLICDILTDCRDPFFGLFARIVVVMYDKDGCVIAKSNEIQCEERGNVFDLTRLSFGKERHIQSLPKDIALRATALDIWQNDDMRGGGEVLEKFERLQALSKAFVDQNDEIRGGGEILAKVDRFYALFRTFVDHICLD